MHERSSSESSHAAPTTNEAMEVDRKGSFQLLQPSSVPLVLVTADCINGFAASITHKFFAVFFKEQVGMPPAYVSMLYLVLPLLLCCASFAAQKVSHRVGRLQITLVLRSVGITIMYCMGGETRGGHILCFKSKTETVNNSNSSRNRTVL